MCNHITGRHGNSCGLSTLLDLRSKPLQYQSHVVFFFFFFSEIAYVASQWELLSPTFPEASNASPLVFSFNTNAS